MIDWYSIERIVDAHRAEAVKEAAQERLAERAAAGSSKPRPGLARAVAKLRALALATGRRHTAAEQVEGC